MNEPTIQRLLAVNLNYLGDALFTTPALASLRAQYPNATIDVLAGERAAAILEGNVSIDRLLVRPPRGGTSRAVALARTLRSGGYDAVVLFQSTLSNALVAWSARVPIRIGFAQEGCGPFLTHAVPEPQTGEHIVDAYTRLAEVRGLSPEDHSYRLMIALSAADTGFADRFFHQNEMVPPVVGLVIGATRAQKRWPEEYFVRLSDKLWKVMGISSVLLGGPEEESAARRISAQADSPLVSAVGKTTEKQLAAIVARLGVVVSGDSGPLHIATAMSAPVVALFGSTDPVVTGPWTPAQGVSAARAEVLYDSLACAPCRKNPTCDGRFDCMRALTPERVYDSVCGLLGLPSRIPLPVFAPTKFASPVEERIPIPALPTTARRAIGSLLVLTKHRFMGDTIVAVPLLRAARKAFPGAQITLLTGAQAAAVLKNCPYTDKVVCYDKETAERTTRGAVRLSLSLAQLLPALRREKPDLCLVADRSLRSAVAAWLCGGRLRAGFDSEGRGGFLTHPIPYDGKRREIECDLDILRAVAPELPGEPSYDAMPELWTTEAEQARGAEILREHGVLLGAKKLVGIQPGASHCSKQWDAQNFAQVADALIAEQNAVIVLIGNGPDELEASRQMQAAMRHAEAVVDLTNQTGLRETMGVAGHLSLFIGNDTGVNHIAASLGVPTVALFGPTSAQKWGNVSPRSVVIAAPQKDMRQIAVAPVIEAARFLLRGDGASDREADALAVGTSR